MAQKILTEAMIKTFFISQGDVSPRKRRENVFAKEINTKDLYKAKIDLRRQHIKQTYIN